MFVGARWVKLTTTDVVVERPFKAASALPSLLLRWSGDLKRARFAEVTVAANPVPLIVSFAESDESTGKGEAAEVTLGFAAATVAPVFATAAIDQVWCTITFALSIFVFVGARCVKLTTTDVVVDLPFKAASPFTASKVLSPSVALNTKVWALVVVASKPAPLIVSFAESDESTAVVVVTLGFAAATFTPERVL